MQMKHPIRGTGISLPAQPAPINGSDGRWSVLPDLVIARATFNLNDRDLAVLRGLISCLPKADHSKTFVFASNVTLSNRTDGMNERTLRRHLANLIAAGLITRHDSPNRKRYTRRDHLGEGLHAFGFDLSPLFARRAEIEAAAQNVKYQERAVAALREKLSLLRQRLLGTDAELADHLRKLLRRKLDEKTLQAWLDKLDSTAPTTPLIAIEMSGSDSQSVRHIQKSIKYLEDSETCIEISSAEKKPNATSNRKPSNQSPALAEIVKACPDSCSYAPEQIKTWQDLIRFSNLIAPMMQIDRSVLEVARRSMGAVATAVSVMCILQMGHKVRSAGAYLRSLSKRAEGGMFSTHTMVNALLSAKPIIGAGG